MRATKPPARETPARTRKWSAKSRALARLAGSATDAMMGAAIGLAFALIATCSPVFGVSQALATTSAPDIRVADFAITCTLAFAIVSALTGLALHPDDDK